jgi:hypothetical protein
MDVELTNSDLNEIMWAGFIHFALGREDIKKQFEEATGIIPYEAPQTGFAALIDKATGYDQHPKIYVRKFIVWVTEELWGVDYAPPGYFKAKEEIESGGE